MRLPCRNVPPVDISIYSNGDEHYVTIAELKQFHIGRTASPTVHLTDGIPADSRIVATPPASFRLGSTFWRMSVEWGHDFGFVW